ncbi:MAG: hypothetical protein GTN99_08095 [Candidatus Dadabacteria bacterium]|nr:hypothetical protein [Candidatus Dadabacteria bacterium]
MATRDPFGTGARFQGIPEKDAPTAVRQLRDRIGGFFGGGKKKTAAGKKGTSTGQIPRDATGTGRAVSKKPVIKPKGKLLPKLGAAAIPAAVLTSGAIRRDARNEEFAPEFVRDFTDATQGMFFDTSGENGVSAEAGSEFRFGPKFGRLQALGETITELPERGMGVGVRSLKQLGNIGLSIVGAGAPFDVTDSAQREAAAAPVEAAPVVAPESERLTGEFTPVNTNARTVGDLERGTGVVRSPARTQTIDTRSLRNLANNQTAGGSTFSADTVTRPTSDEIVDDVFSGRRGFLKGGLRAGVTAAQEARDLRQASAAASTQFNRNIRLAELQNTLLNSANTRAGRSLQQEADYLTNLKDANALVNDPQNARFAADEAIRNPDSLIGRAGQAKALKEIQEKSGSLFEIFKPGSRPIGDLFEGEVVFPLASFDQIDVNENGDIIDLRSNELVGSLSGLSDFTAQFVEDSIALRRAQRQREEEEAAAAAAIRSRRQ